MSRYGTYSTAEAINAGLDLEMPGPTRLRGNLLQGAFASNKVTEYAITQRAREVLNLVKRCAASGIPENAKEETRDTPETAALLKKISAESIVLLKNEGNVLPLKKNKSVSLLSNTYTRQWLTIGLDPHRWPQREDRDLLRWRFRLSPPILRRQPLRRNHRSHRRRNRGQVHSRLLLSPRASPPRLSTHHRRRQARHDFPRLQRARLRRRPQAH